MNAPPLPHADGKPIHIEVRCLRHPFEPMPPSSRHRFTLQPDWTLSNDREDDIDLVVESLSDGPNCFELTHRAVAAFRVGVDLVSGNSDEPIVRAETYEIVLGDAPPQAKWHLKGADGCCGGGFTSPADVLAHLLKPRHLAGLKEADAALVSQLIAASGYTWTCQPVDAEASIASEFVEQIEEYLDDHPHP